MNRILLPLCALACAVLPTGCATLTAPLTQTVHVTSEPSGAYVRTFGTVAGQTPLNLPVNSHTVPQIDVFLPGFAPAACPFKMKTDGGFVTADVLLCVFLFPEGCLSFIDAGGAWDLLESTECHVALQPDGSYYPQPPPPPPPPVPAS